jgi:hypothetical protein
MPKGVTVESLEDELKITIQKSVLGTVIKTVSTGILLYLFPWLFCNWLVSISSEAEKWVSTVSSIMLVILPIALLLLIIYSFLNVLTKTVIRVKPDILEIRWVAPLSSAKKLNPANIKQFYTKKKVYGSKTNKFYSYTLHMVTEEGHESLVTDLKRPEQAQYLEQQIEQILGIKDYPVKDRFERELDRRFDSWQELKKSHNLKLAKGEDNIRATGSYRGHQLKLEALRIGRDSSQTRLTLTGPQDTATSDELLTCQDVERLLASPTAKFNWPGEVQVEARGQILTYKQKEIESNIAFLQFLFDKCCDLLDAYPKIIALGGEATSVLLDVRYRPHHPFRSLARQLLQEIEAETTARLKDKVAHLLCPSCLTRCDKVRKRSFSFYGCRTCGRSRELLAVSVLVAVLDSQTESELSKQDKLLRANWSIRRKIFDFDEVEIVRATDEDVERFAVQAGNDTDPIRQPRYKKMRCAIAPDCQLSKNTMRILQYTFGNVYRR